MVADRVALVTGGGSGIGAAISRELGRAGAFVIVAGRRIEPCAAVAQAIRKDGGAAEELALDVTDERALADLDAAVRRIKGPVAWLVNNAGMAVSAPLMRSETSAGVDLYRAHMDVNFHGARRVLEALLPSMLAAGYGRVVQIASSAALQGYAYVSAYVASKHALLGYTRSAALELAPKGIGLGTICPHYVDSPMTDANVVMIAEKTGRSEEETRAFIASENPGGVLVTPREVAIAARELITGDATGRVIELIGGRAQVVEPGASLTTFVQGSRGSQ